MSAASPPQSLSDRAGFLIIANIIKFAIGVVMPMTLVRLLSQADYGTYQQLVLVSTVAASLLTLGLPTSVFYFYRHVGPERVPALVVQTSLLLLASGAVATAVVYFAATPIAASLGNPEMAGLLALGAASIGFFVASEQSISFLIAQNRYGQAVAFEVGEAALRVALLLIPLWLGYGLPGMVVFGVGFAVIRFAIRNYVLFNSPGLQWRGWRRQAFVAEQLDYSIPVAMIALVALLGTTFNKGVLSAYFGPAQYAVFAVGSIVFPLAQIFQTAVANVLRAELPTLVRAGDLPEIVRIVRESVRKLSIIVLPSFVFLFAHAYQFVTVLFTMKYADSVNVFRICVWELPLDMLILSAIPQVFGKTRANMYINFAVTAAMLSSSYLLIRSFGLYGAALASVGTQYFGVALFFVVVLRLTRTTFAALLPLGGIAKVVLASLAAVVVSRLCAQLTASPFANLLLAGAVFSVAFFAFATPLRAFTDDDRRLLRRWLGKFLPVGAG